MSEKPIGEERVVILVGWFDTRLPAFGAHACSYGYYPVEEGLEKATVYAQSRPWLYFEVSFCTKEEIFTSGMDVIGDIIRAIRDTVQESHPEVFHVRNDEPFFPDDEEEPDADPSY